MKNGKKRYKPAIFLGLLVFAGTLFLTGCEDALTPVIEEEVRLATLPDYTLTILDPAVGSVTPSGDHTLKSGEGLSVSASAPGGYTFVNWEKISGSGDVAFDDQNAASTFVSLIGGSATIQPVISNTLHDLTVGNDGNGTTDPSGTVSVADSVARSISAIPNSAAGYEFDTWELVSGTALFGESSQATTTVIVTGGDAGIRANFRLKTYEVTLTNDGNGSTSPSDTISVTHGQPSSTISATPAFGYRFKNWTTTSGPAVVFNSGASASSTTITATGASTIRANFELQTYDLTVTVTGPGNSIINPSGSPVSVTHGVARSIEAGQPSSRGYYFAGWTKSGGSGSVSFGDPGARSTTVTVTGGDATITANYETINATLSYRGSLDLYLSGAFPTAQRFTVVEDLVYDSGYIYIAGSTPGFASDYAKVMKVNVSNVSSPSFADSVNIALNSDANELFIDGSYLYVAVSGSGGDRYRSSLTTGSGLNSFSDLGHNTPVYHVTGGGWIADSTEISKYYSYDSFDVGSDDPIEDILYIPGFDYLYVTRAAGMSSNGGSETYYYSSGNDTIYLESSYSVDDKTPGKMVYNAPDNIYAVSGDGLITFYVDSEVFDDIDSVSPNASTGSPVDADINDSGNFLITAGTAGTDRLAVFDTHWNNGSVSAPYYIYSRSIRETGEEVIAVEVAGDYVYTLEGTNLVIYELITNTD